MRGVGDPQTARERVLAAAFAEFAAYGVAGARIDRIAAAAKTSKERVYAYFRSKEELYGAVVAEQARETIDNVHLDPHDLPNYVGEVFDFYVGHPDFLRLVQWGRLENADGFRRGAQATIDGKIQVLADAQAAGLVPADIPARDLLAFLFQLSTAWISAVEYQGDLDAFDPAVLAERRAAAVAIAARVFPPA
jgi:AcrR family transcriptional regulator